MHFSFAEVEAALAGLHKIAPAHRTAFASRIKNYQRQGFPPGTKTGRGRAASYNIGHILQLAFVFEFNQLGLLPERAAHTVTANLDAINRAATDCTSYKGMKSGEVFIGFDPSNISDLMDPRYADPANVSFWTYPTEAIQQLFGQWKTPRATSNNLERQGRRLAFVNVTQLISSLAADLSGGAHTEIDIIREISFWNWRASK